MSYRDVNGIEHESYNDACHYYGADDAASLALEAEWLAEREREDYEDRKAGRAPITDQGLLNFDDCPF